MPTKTQSHSGAGRAALPLLFPLPLPHSFHPQNGHFVLVCPLHWSPAAIPATSHRSHARVRPSGVGGRVDGEKYKANIGSVTMDGPIGTEAIRRSFWNQREGQSISPAHGGAIFLCHKRCMAMLSEAFLPLFKWPARFTNNFVIPYLFPLISCLFPHLPLQEVPPIDKTSECSIHIAPPPS